MSHNLEIVDGVASIAYSGETPWHNLGQKCPPDLTPEQMAERAGSDFEVYKAPAFIEVNGKKVSVPSGALMRRAKGKIKEDIYLSHLPKLASWHELQNSEAFAFFHEFVAAGDMAMETVGHLGRGEMVWALARIKESFYVMKKKDEVQSYLLFTNPHEFGRSINVLFTPVRVVCNNTLTMALSETGQTRASASHRNPFNADDVKAKLGLAHYKMGEYKERAQFLASKRYNKESVVEYFKRVFPLNEPKPRVAGATEPTRKPKEFHRGATYSMAILDTQPGADLAPGTWWNAYNAATFYTNHLAGKNDSSRVKSLWYGESQKTNERALKEALLEAEKA